MKPKTVFLDQMTNPELEEFLKHHHTVFIPVGATEQHGPHSPLGTDVFLPREIARRVAEKQGNALVAPAVPYALSYPHRGFTGEFSLSIETFMAVIREIAVSFGKAGFKRIVFLNGHYDNTYALAYACAQAAEQLPSGAKAFPFNHWDGLTPEESAQFGMHAGLGEVSMVLAINPDWVDMDRLNAEHPNFPDSKTKSAALHTAFFYASPGSVYRITESGTWGDATGATAEKGAEFLGWGVRSVIDLLDDLEQMFAQAEIR
ncbi:MAG: creatininase family protein [Verrucomicrobiota bacterium]